MPEYRFVRVTTTTTVFTLQTDDDYLGALVQTAMDPTEKLLERDNVKLVSEDTQRTTKKYIPENEQ